MTAARVRIADFDADHAAIRRVRFAVFVDEQRVPESLEIDDRDPCSLHVLAEAGGATVGTGRIDVELGGKIGRVAVLPTARAAGVGTAIMRALHALAAERGLRRVWCHAQVQAEPFYARLGYRPVGERFFEAGIEHVKMEYGPLLDERQTSDMPGAFHAATDDLPFADDWGGAAGVRLKLLMADVEGARFAVRIRFAPGVLLPPHKHTGEVHAFTLSGEWSYLEHPDAPPSRAGSYLFEPPGSTHTLKVADHNTEETDVVFVVYGAMIHLGPGGEVLAIGDAASHLRDWPAALRAQGKPVPAALPIGGAMRYRPL